MDNGVILAASISPRLACKTKAQDGDWIDLPETMRGVILTDTLTLPKAQAGRSGLGAAVDLGTTTVALRLFDRADGKLLAQAQDWNAQAPYGADVISRIQYTLEKPDGLPELSRRIREQIWALVSDALARSGRTPGTLREITLAGNTVMQHLFAGYSVRGIAAAPFRPETLFAAPGDETLHGVPVHFAPCVAGYVGGDITAGLLAAGLALSPSYSVGLRQSFSRPGTSPNSSGIAPGSTKPPVFPVKVTLFGEKPAKTVYFFYIPVHYFYTFATALLRQTLDYKSF